MPPPPVSSCEQAPLARRQRCCRMVHLERPRHRDWSSTAASQVLLKAPLVRPAIEDPLRVAAEQFEAAEIGREPVTSVLATDLMRTAAVDELEARSDTPFEPRPHGRGQA